MAMIRTIYIGLLGILNITHCYAADEEEITKCPPPPIVKKVVDTTPVKKTTPLLQEISIHCGAVNTTQNNDTSEKRSVEKKRPDDDASIPKLLEAIAKILSSIAWPIATVVIAYHFKKELAALLNRLKKFKAGSAEAEFAELLRNAEAAADTGIETTANTQSISPSTIESAAENPRGSILSAWLEVEAAIFKLYDVKGLNRPTRHASSARSVVPLMREIQKAGLLDTVHVGLFHDLRALRNEAAHTLEFDPPAESVIRYIQLAKVLCMEITRVTNAG